MSTLCFPRTFKLTIFLEHEAVIQHDNGRGCFWLESVIAPEADLRFCSVSKGLWFTIDLHICIQAGNVLYGACQSTFIEI